MPSSTNPVFSFDSYDVIGLDLDHTLARYQLPYLYRTVSDNVKAHLVELGYPDHVFGSLEEGKGFFRKFLTLDKSNGTLLQLSKDRTIQRACRGTKRLSEQEIEQLYGPARTCEGLDKLPAIRGTCNDVSINRFAQFKDYFTIPSQHVCAKLIDFLDIQPGSSHKYWEDVYSSYVKMYRREAFQEHTGGFFPAVKDAPDKMFHACTDGVLQWLKHVKQSKKLFLLTGSNIDFASTIANCCLGKDWKKYFDIIITFAKKPGFFYKENQFYTVTDVGEDKPVPSSENLVPGEIYSQGNVKKLTEFFSCTTGKRNPKIVYIGDSVEDDVMAPVIYSTWDTVAIVEEIAAECVTNGDIDHDATDLLASDIWGSFFADTNGPTALAEVIAKHSKIAVPSLEYIGNYSLSHQFSAFDGKDCLRGYHPSLPTALLQT